MDNRRRPLPRARRTVDETRPQTPGEIPQTQRHPQQQSQTTRQTQNQVQRPSQSQVQTKAQDQHPRQTRTTTTVTGRKKSKPIAARIGAVILKTLAFVLATVLFLLVVVAGSLKMICSDSNPSAQSKFVTTILETGKLKFLANMFASKNTIQRIIDSNKMEEFNEEIDSSLITIPDNGDGGGNGNADEKDIEVIEIPGPTYKGTLLIIKDPSRVSVATIFPWREAGETLDVIAKNAGAVAAINGGLYNSYVNKGGQPYGVVVSNHEIQYNAPQDFAGLVLIGFTDDNILQIIDINGWGPADVEALVNERHIRDAVTFQEESTDANNHFVQLILNGEPRDLNGGTGGGLNPRTVIGQRADGAVLMLVTDGRGKNNHLGASASDLIDIMQKYGAVNAANLDGGSSSCMYYDGEYLMTSVTFYYTNASWNLPLAFVVK